MARNGEPVGLVGWGSALWARVASREPEVMFVFVLYPRAKAKEVLRAYRDYTKRAPDEVIRFFSEIHATAGSKPAAGRQPA